MSGQHGKRRADRGLLPEVNMSEAWGHTLRQLSAGDVAYYRRASYPCSWPKCKENPTHEARFKSVTGRAGRVNERRKMLCDEHAAAFAAKNEVAVDAA